MPGMQTVGIGGYERLDLISWFGAFSATRHLTRVKRSSESTASALCVEGEDSAAFLCAGISFFTC